MTGRRKAKPFGRFQGFSVGSIGLIFLLLWAGCKENAPSAPPPAPKVTVVQPVWREVTDHLELYGNTQAVNTVQLVARVAGYLEKVFFQDGAFVKKDQPLFLIQQNTYRARLQQAESQVRLQKAQLEHAQIELARHSKLLEKNASSQTEVENWKYQRESAQASLRAAEAQLELARLDLSYTEVRAPFDGRIDRRLKDTGNMVGSDGNTLLAEFKQIDPIYVYVTISDLDLARLMKSPEGIPGRGNNPGRPISMGLTNEEGYPHQGRLDFAAISLTPSTGTLLMRGVFPNPEGKILPGLFARMSLPIEEKSAFLVPEVAIGNDQQGSYVLIVNGNNTVERRSVRTGPPADNLRAIEEGLDGKEWVIVKGLLRAIPGQAVTPEREAAR
jgi:RND family efflux transporter MFP subunit